MKIEFNPDDVTIGDLEDFEEISGCTWPSVFNGQQDNPLLGKAKVQLAIVFLSGRREDPSFSLDDARKLKVNELEISEPEGEEAVAGPTEAEATPSDDETPSVEPSVEPSA